MIEKIYNTVFEADSAYLSNLGNEGTYHSEFEVRLKTLELLGGDMTKKYTLLYEIECAILDIMGGDSTLCTNLYEARKEIAILQGVDVTDLNTVYLLANAGADILPVTGSSYVTFTAKQKNSTLGLVNLSTNQTLEYSTDTTNWNTMNTSTSIKLLNVGDEVYVRGILNGDNDLNSHNYTQFKMSGKIAASGSCNAIWNYKDLEAPLKKYCGLYLFRKCSSLIEAPELPATVLADNCYNAMFQDCTYLTTAPTLPATTLADYCYFSMFEGCKSLTTVPELPATTLAYSCYCSMFVDCTTLTEAPQLPATVLADTCYSGMFVRCTSLTTAPELTATTLAYSCYSAMFQGCTSLTTAPELPATTLANSCYSAMFDGCYNLQTAPELPATTLAYGCYRGMFYNCNNLQTAPELPATTLDYECYYEMFYNCTALTIAPKLPATTLTYGCYNYMFYNCYNLTQITCLATDISIGECLTEWTYNVSGSGEFIKAKNMNDWQTCSSYGIPCNWNVSDYLNYFYIEADNYNTNNYLNSLNLTDTSEIQIKYIDSWDQESDWMNYNDFGGNGYWHKIYFRYTGSGSLSSLRQRWGDEPAKLFDMGNYYKIGGDIHTLMFNYTEDIDEITENQAFQGLFKDDNMLIDASNLVLPAKTISYMCYWQMFMGCSSLTKGPIIEATQCSEGSLNRMFTNCGNLIQITCYYPAYQLSYSYSENWVGGVSSNGVFYGDFRDGFSYGESYVPYGWETVNIVSDN